MVNSLGSSTFSPASYSYGTDKAQKAKETQKQEPDQGQGVSVQPQAQGNDQQPFSLTGGSLNAIA